MTVTRAALTQDARARSRNGCRDATVKTTAGPVTLARPKLRGTTEAFASRLFGSHVTKTDALESLVIASFIRGLPVRDVEATLADAPGDQAAISKSTVSSVCQRIRDDYEAWSRRRLPAFQLHRKNVRRDPPPGQGHRPAARRDELPHPWYGPSSTAPPPAGAA